MLHDRAGGDAEILGFAWEQIAWESKGLRIDPPTDAKRTKGEGNGPFVFQKNGERLRQIVRWKSARMLDRYYIVNEGVVAPAVPKRFGNGKQLAKPWGCSEDSARVSCCVSTTGR